MPATTTIATRATTPAATSTAAVTVPSSGRVAPTPALLELSVHLQSALLRVDDAVRAHRRTRRGAHRHDHEHAPGPEHRNDGGQATTEYALVLLAAALVGLMVVAWATAGGGGARISRLFNSVIDSVIDRV